MTVLARHLDRRSVLPGLLIFGRRDRVHYPEVFESLPWFRALDLTGDLPRPVLLARLFAGIRAAAADFRPDIIHSSLNKANHAVRATALACRWPVPIVTSVRNDFRRGHSGGERLAERLLAHRSARIVTNSEAVRGQLLADLRLTPERVVTIANAVDPHFLVDEAGPPPPWWPPGRVALVVGRFTEQKNQIGLMRALAAIAAAQGLADWHVVLVGEGGLEAEIRAAAPPGRVVLAPPVGDLLPLYRAASLLVLPSLWEGMPNVAMEAQVSGCPVAITQAANGAEVVAASNGWIVAGDLAVELGRVLATPPPQMSAMGAASRRAAASRHSAAAMAAATEAVYRDILDRHPTARIPG